MQTVPYRRWSPPQSILRIEFPPNLLSSIPTQSAARGTGLLYGWRNGSDARILAVRAWPDDRPVPAPEQEHDPLLASLHAIGIFVYRSRGEVFLTEKDLALFEKRRAHLALVIAGGRAGFFIKEADGTFRTIRSYEEFPTAGERLAGLDAQRRLAPAARPAPRRRSTIAWSWAAAVVTALLAIPFAGLAYFTPLLPAAAIALAVHEREGQLVATWNARAISRGAQLEIRDGAQHTVVPLEAGQSSATYFVRDGDLEVSIETSHGSEIARFVTRPAAAARKQETEEARVQVAQIEEQLRQLQETAAHGRARILELNGQMVRLTRH
jgi:hypothetical protein